MEFTGAHSWLKSKNVFLFRSNGHTTHAFNNVLGLSDGPVSFSIDNLPEGPLMGFISYDAKNKFESLNSSHTDQFHWPDSFFIQPRVVKEFGNDELDRIIENYPLQPPAKVKIEPRTSHNEYIQQVNRLKAHILRGDIYEVNYCIEFFAENVKIDPFSVFIRLSRLTKAPFSCYVKKDKVHVLCASPERYLARQNNRLISQPMKGTIGRGKSKEEDDHLKNRLYEDPKERNENVMIVDLVRNDLSRIAKKGTVKVDELFGIRSFLNVHQMVSTVSCELNGSSFAEIISNTFPMGSMTGAPKVRAMELIEEHENFRRGLYSGCIGCINSNGDFDFNVVIRSIFFNEENGYLSFSVGSAITAACDPEKEYQECLLKAQSLLACLQ